jgi:hypothetical protein
MSERYYGRDEEQDAAPLRGESVRFTRQSDGSIFAKTVFFPWRTTFRDYLTVGPDPLTLDSTRLSAQGYNRQAVRRESSMKSLVAWPLCCGGWILIMVSSHWAYLK